ncbi:MAG: molybdenum cofactor guanylyltransferase [Sphingobacteriaceae bacterium]|nr:MAG: molybdenum cofactor guanylyltransferase [Sphingobacteriaceae bacterium]
MQNVLKGLVLAGGKSTRMGTDKAKICWHGKEQQYYLADLLALYCGEVFISCRSDQQQHIDKNYKVLVDNYADSGPLEAILTAFENKPNCGWIVIACDLPLLNKKTLDELVKQRDANKIATVFKSPVDDLPEPLIGIWEQASFELLKNNHQKQHRSLRKLLITNAAKIIKAPDAGALINANTPEDAAYINKIIGAGIASFTG